MDARYWMLNTGYWILDNGMRGCQAELTSEFSVIAKCTDTQKKELVKKLDIEC